MKRKIKKKTKKVNKKSKSLSIPKYYATNQELISIAYTFYSGLKYVQQKDGTKVKVNRKLLKEVLEFCGVIGFNFNTNKLERILHG